VVHVLSETALATLLDALETADARRPGVARLFRLEHVDECSAAEAHRLARLGIVVCSNPSMLGEWRREEDFPLRTLLDNGVSLCLGSDFVGQHQPERPLSPLGAIARAVTHGGRGERERITPVEALRAYTIGSAIGEGLELEKGSLTAGRLADLIVLSADPTHVAPEELARIEVLMTLVGGRVVHRVDGFGEPLHERASPPATIGPPLPVRRTPTIGPAPPSKN
jgi:predicted amidohydrolase YtcJ